MNTPVAPTEPPKGLPPAETALSAGARTRRRWSLARRLLFIAMTITWCGVLFLVACELLLKFFAPQPLLPRYVTDSGFGIRRHNSNISVWHTTPEYRSHVRTNSRGMRCDREIDYAKPAGVYRIVGLGDSYTFGYGVDVEGIYLSLVEKQVSEKCAKAEVVNLGVAGLGTAEQLIMLQKEGLKYDPDLVVVGHYANDIGDNLRSLLYVLDDQGRLARKREAYLPAVKTREWLYSFWLYRYLAERSHLLYFVRTRLSESIQKKMMKDNARESGIEGDEALRLSAALLDEIKAVAAARGAKFLLLDIPSDNGRSRLPRDLFKNVTAAEIVDVRAEIEEGMKIEKLYWQRSDGHWTPAGHRIAAAALTDRICAAMGDGR